MPSRRAAVVLLAIVATACGGGGETDTAAVATPSGEALPPPTEQDIQADSIRRANEVQLTRETFSYTGGTRDPFSSLFNLSSTGPEIQDLALVGIYLDPDRHGNSIALVRERSSGRPHRLRVGDQLGRARLAQIRRMDIVFTIEDFGFERQETLALPKRDYQARAEPDHDEP